MKRLRAAGFELARSDGPHDIYRGPGGAVSVPRHKELKENTARAILKDAGLEP